MIKQKCEYLWNKIKSSKETLFVIGEQETVQFLSKCYVLQVDIGENIRRKACVLGKYYSK